jgi:hypothetical protein
MANGDDTQDMCCAIGLCCGGDDDVKRRKAIHHIIKSHLGSEPPTIDNIADVIIEVWDLTPKSWGWGVLMKKIGSVARTFPYV